MISLVVYSPFLHPSLHLLLAGAHFHQIHDPLGWESAVSSCTGLVLPEACIYLPWSPPPLEFQSKETSVAHSVDDKSAWWRALYHRHSLSTAAQCVFCRLWIDFSFLFFNSALDFFT